MNIQLFNLLVSLYVIYQVQLLREYHAQEDAASLPASIDTPGGEPSSLRTLESAASAFKIDGKNNQESCEPRDAFENKDTSSEKYPHFYPVPLPPYMDRPSTSNFRVGAKPVIGKHRCSKNAVMAFAHGYQLPELIHFVTSLWQTGYDGDLVIGVGRDLTQETRSFFEDSALTHPGLVVYEVPLSCQRKNSCQVTALIEQERIDNNGWKSWNPMPDGRTFRRVSVIRYEYFWAWTTKYNANSMIFLSDARDVYFQRDPIKTYLDQSKSSGTASTKNDDRTLVFFQEASKIKESTANSKWMAKTYSSQVRDDIGEKMVVCSGTTLGTQAAVEVYTRAMIYEFDKTRCKHCANKHDQCFHNFLIHQDRLVGSNGGGISNVILHAQGEGGIVNTISNKSGKKSLHELGVVDSKTQQVFDNDGKTLSAVVHMYDRDEKLKEFIDLLIERELLDYQIGKSMPSRAQEQK